MKMNNYVIFLLILEPIFNENKNEIALIVNNQKTNLINISYYFSFSEIVVNNKMANTNNYTNLLNQNKNNVIIKCRADLTTCLNMFTDLKNILCVDTTNFTLSNVKNMYKIV